MEDFVLLFAESIIFRKIKNLENLNSHLFATCKTVASDLIEESFIY